MTRKNKYDAPDFYPTPRSLLDKIMDGFHWHEIQSVLEPSAGKGDIVQYVTEVYSERTCGNDLDIDCVEIDPDLRSTLQGKGYRVVHDDFLTFHTYKHYDLIVMNPPFSQGAVHLTKALDMQENGGCVICILNAETLRNQCTNERKALVKRLSDINAEITYMEGEFVYAERPTDVEIAVVKAFYPEPERESFIIDDLKKKQYSEPGDEDMTDLAPNDFIRAIVQRYNLEAESGIRLIHEYEAMRPYLLKDIREPQYSCPILELKMYNKKEISVNGYIRKVRGKYWNALFQDPKFIGKMTSKMASDYRDRVYELSEYDFSVYNIRCLQEKMTRELVKGIEDCVIDLFDKLSCQYSYSDEFQNNIHYYNGWKTNKAWYINKKVILPFMNAFSTFSGEFFPVSHVKSKLADIEKALNYLDGGLTDAVDLEHALKAAEDIGQTKKIRLKYFYVTFLRKVLAISNSPTRSS